MKHVAVLLIALALCACASTPLAERVRDLPEHEQELIQDMLKAKRVMDAGGPLAEQAKVFLQMLNAAMVQELPDAYYHMGVLYAVGIEGLLEADAGMAIRFYRTAGKKDHVNAQYAAALLLTDGRVEPRDHVEAAGWLTKAAMNGHTKAQGRLAYAFYFGRGVPQNYVQFYAWITVALAQNSTAANAAAHRDAVAEMLSPDRLAYAQGLASEYWTRYVVPFMNEKED